MECHEMGQGLPGLLFWKHFIHLRPSHSLVRGFCCLKASKAPM